MQGFPRGAGLNEILIRKLRRKVPHLFLSACGDDAFYVQKGIRRLRYNPIDDAAIIDFGLERHPLTSTEDARWNGELAAMVDGVIPVMYDYEVGYAGQPNLCPAIPLPVNIHKVQMLPNEPTGRIVVMHGAGRPGFKGTRFVLEAFDILNTKYPADFEFIHVANLPIADYLKLMERVNVVVDQTSGYSCGMNALFALAMGKVVLSGAEPESTRLYSGASTPVRNILPNAHSIVEQMEAVLAVRSRLSEIGMEGRRFVEEHHDYRSVAQRYLDTWLLSGNSAPLAGGFHTRGWAVK